MIARYSRLEMSKIWNDRNKFNSWLKVELAVCARLAEEKLVPAKEWKILKNKVEDLLAGGGVDPRRVDELEAITKHDVIAFTTAVAEKVGPTSRYIHYGLTSSDVVDTALCLMIQDAGALISKDLMGLQAVLKRLAKKYEGLPTIGRTHGIFAEPSSFGMKFLGWFAEGQRNAKRWDRAVDGLRVGKLSGAVGVNAHWSPVFEERVLKSLGLRREEVSTQVIPRDRHAELMQTIALVGASLERIAIELRLLQQSEIAEVREGFSKGQKGSSAMPHKRNPISSENIAGCARLLRSYANAALENVALWHERDISHSSVERVALSDSMLLLDYMIHRMTGILENLIVDGQAVQANLMKAGPTVFSGHFLLELVKLGISREDAYAWVQSCALAALEGKGDFLDLLVAHDEIRKRIPEKKLRELGSPAYQLRNVKQIYKRVLKS